MKGKERCRILKDIRRSIAQANGIEYVTEECKHKGECRGTCPKCESEVAYLERELDKRRSLGRSVAVAGLAVGIGMSLTGCTDINFNDICFETEAARGAESKSDKNGNTHTEKDTEFIEIDGEIAIDGDIDINTEMNIGGLIPMPPEYTESTVVDISPMGDIAILPLPSIDKVLEVSAFELESSIVYRTREDIRSEWGTCLISTNINNTEDVFLIPESNGATVTVTYDKNGAVSSYRINRK